MEYHFRGTDISISKDFVTATHDVSLKAVYLTFPPKVLASPRFQ